MCRKIKKKRIFKPCTSALCGCGRGVGGVFCLQLRVGVRIRIQCFLLVTHTSRCLQIRGQAGVEDNWTDSGICIYIAEENCLKRRKTKGISVVGLAVVFQSEAETRHIHSCCICNLMPRRREAPDKSWESVKYEITEATQRRLRNEILSPLLEYIPHTVSAMLCKCGRVPWKIFDAFISCLCCPNPICMPCQFA